LSIDAGISILREMHLLKMKLAGIFEINSKVVPINNLMGVVGVESRNVGYAEKNNK